MSLSNCHRCQVLYYLRTALSLSCVGERRGGEERGGMRRGGEEEGGGDEARRG